jgi:uncharacterized protein (DUF433 family)
MPGGEVSVTVDVLPADDRRATLPLYTAADASFYLGVPESTLRRWVQPSDDHIALITALPQTGHKPFIPFIGLAEAFILAAARRERLTPRAIREGVEAIKAEYGIDHALAHRMIYFDLVNKEIGISRSEQHHERARDRQMQFLDAVAPYLVFLDFGYDDYARRITLPRFPIRVTASPFVAGGDPIVQKTSVRLRDILSLQKAGASFDEIGEEAGLTADEVEGLLEAAAGKPS